MSLSCPLSGLAQVNLVVDDVPSARDWYSRFLGFDPYFQRPDPDCPAYVEYRVGDEKHELGIIDGKFVPELLGKGPGGGVVRWHTEDIEGTVARLLELGASEFEAITEREGGFLTASVLDPFGNILGLIYSPHYREVAARRVDV
jgi:catechol 2,3-dioxygenase-like lactoylglutathione lyase family enzyme